MTHCIFVLAGDKPADQGPRGQLRGAACQPTEGVEQLPGEEGAPPLLFPWPALQAI